MPLIKIVSGTYGHREGARIIAKNPKSAPFKVEADEAKRLIKLGVAQIVGAKSASKLEAPAPSKDAGEALGSGDTSPYGELTNRELKALLDERGATYEKQANKATLIELLAATDVADEDGQDDDNSDDDGQDDTEPPVITPTTPVI
jgi:hypothetical protein